MTETRFHATMAFVCLAIAAFSAYGVQETKIEVPLDPLVRRGALLLILLAGAVYLNRIRRQRMANFMLMTFWALLVSNLHVFPMFIAARQKVEVDDAFLAQMDAALGVDVPTILRLMEAYPRLNYCLEIAYETLVLMLMAAIVLPPLCNQMHKAKEFAISNMVAASIGIFIFGVFQAEGPWTYYGHVPSHNQEQYGNVFAQLKSEGWFTIDYDYAEGLVCFPSFHAALSIMAAWALWFHRFLRWPASFLALAITVSTVTTGVHYLVDTLAGIVLALVGIAAARGYLWLESRGIAERGIREVA